MKQVKAIIERAKDGFYSIYMDDDTLDYGCIGTGESIPAAKADFNKAYGEMRAHYLSENRPFEEVSFTFQTDYVSLLQYYAQTFTLVALARITGINKGQLSHYINETSTPSARTIEKIKQGLARFSTDLNEFCTASA